MTGDRKEVAVSSANIDIEAAVCIIEKPDGHDVFRNSLLPQINGPSGMMVQNGGCVTLFRR
jgi:hypothetical protein